MSSSSINAAGAVPDPTYGAPSNNATQEGGVFAPASQSSPGASQDSADLRLVIEDDKAAGSFVYKTIDRRTGTMAPFAGSAAAFARLSTSCWMYCTNS